MEEAFSIPCQLLTGSSLAGTFGRGRHRGVAKLSADRLQFVDNKAGIVFDAALTEISEIDLTKLGVLHISAAKKVRLFMDGTETGEVTDSTLGDVMRAFQTLTLMKGLHHNLMLAWEKARGEA